MSAQNENAVHDAYTYTIPPEIRKKIPGCFYAALIGELCAIYGPSVFAPDEDGNREYVYHEGTFAWDAAVWMACKKCGLRWLYEYYHNLEWFQSDLFDAEITEEIEACLTSGQDIRQEYYRYIYDYQAEEDSGYPREMKWRDENGEGSDGVL